MQNTLKNRDNVYTITYQVDSYFPISGVNVIVSWLFNRIISYSKEEILKTWKWWDVLAIYHYKYSKNIFRTNVYQYSYIIQNTWYNWHYVYTITYQVDSYLPFKGEVWQLFGYITELGTIWNNKFTRLASGDIFWSVYTLHIQIIYW